MPCGHDQLSHARCNWIAKAQGSQMQSDCKSRACAKNQPPPAPQTLSRPPPGRTPTALAQRLQKQPTCNSNPVCKHASIASLTYTPHSIRRDSRPLQEPHTACPTFHRFPPIISANFQIIVWTVHARRQLRMKNAAFSQHPAQRPSPTPRGNLHGLWSSLQCHVSKPRPPPVLP